MRQRAAMLVRLAAVIGVSALAGCDSGDRTLTEVDPAAAPRFPGYDEVVVILERNCVPCHAAGKPAPDAGARILQDGEGRSPKLDTCEGIQAGFGDVLRVVTEETMPPGAWPRLTDREKLILRNWFVNSGGCSPCTEPCP